MKSAQFTNFSTEPFTGFWDGKGKTFAPGKSMYMGDYLAKHFAKHLTNRELLKLGKERSTSPKRPDDVPEFMELFNKAYQAEEEEIEMTDGRDSLDVEIDMANRNRETEKGVQMIDVPDDGEDEESEFPSIPEVAPAAEAPAAPTEQAPPAPRRGRPPMVRA
jgi:hypothetical protein